MEKIGLDPEKIRVIIRNYICDQDSNNISEKAQIVIRSLHDEFDRDIEIPYDVISEYVFNSSNENSSENNEALEFNIKILIKEYSGKNKEKLSSNLDKIRRHYSLAQIQKKYINNFYTEVRDIVDRIEPIVRDMEEQTKNYKQNMSDIKSEVDSVKETKSGIYTDFISILGVFSAFVFLMFGGIEVVRAVFDVADQLESISLSRLLVLGSLMLIAVMTLMYSLLLWVARITGKKFGNCMREGCEDGCTEKVRHAFYRHSFYFSMMLFLGAIVLIAHTVYILFGAP